MMSKRMMENHSDAPPTKRTALPGAVAAAAPGPQTAAPGSQTAVPGSDAATSAIASLIQPSLSNDDAPHDVHVQVEAFGSGAILHGGLGIPSNKSVGDLRKLVLASSKLPPRTRTVRLFVGHGGTELDNDDEILLSGSLAAVDLDTTPLVAFPVPCKCVLWTWCHSKTAGDEASTHCCNACFSFCVVDGRAGSRCSGCAAHARVVRRRWDSKWH